MRVGSRFYVNNLFRSYYCGWDYRNPWRQYAELERADSRHNIGGDFVTVHTHLTMVHGP
ncbi:MAG: hypothetical protein Q8K82_12475 [Gemmatimonadaceae bacterium]|nr:hypothetical protein [Gemmatimonadaceae bacterium]